MCGIIGCIGKENCLEILLNGLLQLQNRGYDSAGTCLINNNKFITKKFASTENESALEKLNNNKSSLDSKIGIGHTRWATHGKKNDINSHPHISYDNKISLVHNGIIENFDILKKELISKDITFKSETDTEVIANLLAYNLINSNESFITALKKTLSQLEGTWGLAILYSEEPNKIYCVRHGSPLLVSVTENFALIASEVSGFNNLVNNYFVLNNNDICEIILKNDLITCSTNHNYDLKTVKDIKLSLTPEPFPHWTKKEIFEQYESSLRTISFGGRIIDNTEVRLGGLIPHVEVLKRIDNIIFLGCGTSYFAALLGMNYFKKMCSFNTLNIIDGAEFVKEDIPRFGNTLLILLSQSGETKDLHRCIEIAKDEDLFMMGVVNVVDSMIAREVHCGVYLNAGREVGVASTKSFTSQVIALSLISLWFSKLHNVSNNKRMKFLNDIRNLPKQIKKTIEISDELIKKKKLLDILKINNSMFLLGKGECEAIAKEGALKIKEISYYHSEGYSGSSLKHGPFALLDKNFPVILIAPKDKNYAKMKNAYQEIKSREAPIIVITDDYNNTFENSLVIPNNNTFNSLLSIIPIQLIAYYLSIDKKLNPDFPRNLAKSVVVE
jgi:glucosamine--fructose-6-phosphate aminotransferase (isomerizing)